MTKEKQFLVDMFILEVADGDMPKEGSPERIAYEEYRAEEENIESDEWQRHLEDGMGIK